MMRLNVTAVVALIGALLPGAALAQSPDQGRDTQLQQEMRHRRVIMRPGTPVERVQQDVDRATTQIEGQQRRDALVREVTQPSARGTYADADLRGGIQTRSLGNALRR
jgi:hypothetical protein